MSTGRLFGKIRAVKKIITALTKSIVPVMNAFTLMFAAVCVCKQPFFTSLSLSLAPSLSLSLSLSPSLPFPLPLSLPLSLSPLSPPRSRL